MMADLEEELNSRHIVLTAAAGLQPMPTQISAMFLMCFIYS
jgi:hypothetical protein